MEFDQVVQEIRGQVLHRGRFFSEKKIVDVIVSDLMSDVLLTEAEDVLLVTSLPSEQVARTADMVGACGVVLTNDKSPQPGLLELVRELDLILIKSPLSSFEASWKLGCLLNGSVSNTKVARS